MNLLEPTNHRISNSLFDAINRVRNGVAESTVATEGAVDKAHFCATHVEHALLGKGTCISEQHAEPDENGDIAWYSVEFPSGIQRVNTSNLKIVEGKSHSHGKKMAEEEEQIDELSINTLTRVKSAATSAASDASREGDEDKATKRYNLAGNASNKIEKANRAAGLKPSGQHQFGEGNDGNLANNAKPYDKITHGDVISGRLGKDEMGGKKKKVAEARSTGTVFDKPKDNPLTKDIKSAFNKKQVPTGTVYTRKPPAKVKENVTQTIINHNDFVLEVTDNPTYGDYLKALQSMVGQANEDVQKEIVTIATEAFKENYTDVIIESQTKKIFESKFEEIRKSGAKVLGENYMVDSGEPYVEYTVEKDGKAIQYVHLGTIKKV